MAVLLGNNWYFVPPLPGNWDFNSIGYMVKPGETESRSYNLTMCGDLPDGTYRIEIENLAANFTIPVGAQDMENNETRRDLPRGYYVGRGDYYVELVCDTVPLNAGNFYENLRVVVTTAGGDIFD